MLCEVLLDIAGEFAAADDATADCAGSSACELAEWWSAASSSALPIGIVGVGCRMESAAALSPAAAETRAPEATEEAPEGTGEGMGLRAEGMEGSGGLATPRPLRARPASQSGGGEVAAPVPVCEGEWRAVCAVGGCSCSCACACDCVWRSSACIT